jgi:catechol 2,3-dioxygenase-like lactoylglutathione lyase family enzyme
MLSTLAWLGLEAKDIDAARAFYEKRLDLPVSRAGDDEVTYDVGDQQLRLRRPTAVPRGGLHTHYAMATPPDRYDDWWARLDADHDLVEHRFGDARSLYLYDPDGNCVEIGSVGDGDAPLTGIFEVVLEVASLPAAEALYTDLGFEPVDRGESRRRVRLSGPVDLELWEPQLGLADARGGVHVDLGFDGDPETALAAAGDRATAVERLDDGVRFRDPDGHWLTVA